MNCQNSLILFEKNGENVRIHNLITIGAENMIRSDGLSISAKDNLAFNMHPYWSQIAVYDPIQVKTNPCTGKPLVPKPKTPEGSWNAVRSEVDGPLAYFTIVNGSPYNFKLTSQHSYQMIQWAWVDVPAGRYKMLVLDRGRLILL